MLGLSCCTGYSPVGARAFSLQRPLLLPSSRRVGFSSSGSSGLRCSTACGILLDQGPNPGLLHWQADSLPLSHQGKPPCILDTMARVNKLDHTILYFFFWPCGVFLSQGLNQCPLKGNRGAPTTGPPGKSPPIQLFEKVIPQENVFNVCSWCSP